MNRNKQRPDISRRIKEFRKKLREVIKQLLINLIEILEPILKPLFAINQASAILRSMLFVAAIFLWGGYAYVVAPPDFSVIDIGFPPLSGDPVDLVLYQLGVLFAQLRLAAKPLFDPEVLRFVLVIGFAFWLTSRAAAIYLADIFELPNVRTAIRFIRQAAFISDRRQLGKLMISEAKIPSRFAMSPVFQIGGPGVVTASLENLAVFEKVDGAPNIISPEKSAVIEGFERLRKIIDLRDQFIDNDEVSGRTKDGIPVTAKGIRYSFSVKRDKSKMVTRDEWGEEKLGQPLTFVEDSILKIVYEKPNLDFPEIGRAEVREHIRKFISENTLDQFLVDSEDERSSQASQPTAQTLPYQPGGNDFKGREMINRALEDAINSSRDTVIELHWISVGTWVTPPEIPKMHLEAWQKRLQGNLESTDKALTGVEIGTRVGELERLIQDIPLNTFGAARQQHPDPDEVVRQVALAYREAIRSAYQIYKEENVPVPPNIEIALKYLLKKL